MREIIRPHLLAPEAALAHAEKLGAGQLIVEFRRAAGLIAHKV